MPTLDVTPEKRLYLSVISEYDLPKAICELIDNAIDYSKKNKKSDLEIIVSIDADRQTIQILDNAGGVPASDLGLLLSPGRTTNEISDNLIGYFGVGAKRAVVALAADITIKTRFGRKETCRIHFDDEWINEVAEWELEYDVLPQNITSGTTIIELFKLRSPITSEDIENLQTHLAETYGLFLTDGIFIKLNGTTIPPIIFTENWTYASGYEPILFKEKIDIDDRQVDVEILCGLIDYPGDPDSSYGVFFYCNNRMIARGLTDFSVGFESGKIGNPHYNISIVRTVVKLSGQSRDMPWNSSKSGIDTKHTTFQKLRNSIINITTTYAKISRSLQGKWDDEIFPYTEGTISEQSGFAVENIPRNLLPTPPASKPKWAQRVTKANSSVNNKKVWAEGLQDSIIAADAISKMNLKQKSRVALIILDSTLEIAYKEYLVNEQNIGLQKFSTIARNRSDVQKEVFKHITVSKTDENLINHFYRLRNDLVHQRATPNVSESDVIKYKKVVEGLLKKMFGLRFQV